MHLFIVLESRLLRSVLLALVLSAVAGVAVAAKGDRNYQLDYTIALQPKKDSARVTVRISDGALIKSIDFGIDPDRHTNIKGDGRVRIKGDRAIWKPSKGPAKFDFTAKISNKRDNGKYDARMTEDWAIFRGDKLIPAASVRALKGATSEARLKFHLPRGWSNVDTGWPRDDDGSFIIDNPDRHFDRPLGWVIAGKIFTRSDFLSGTEISIGAPTDSGFHRMDVLTLVNYVWPQVERIFQKLPPKILVIGAGDPMWRGGLSSPNSLYMHADRPLISENATSTLLHEMTHVITRIRGGKNADWIAEGLAEYYSVELVYRSGGMTDARYRDVQKRLKDWSKDVTDLQVKRSSGPITAKAVLLLQQLDKEIRVRTNNRKSLDNVTRKLMQERKVSLDMLREKAEKLVGGKLKTLDSPLLQ